MRDKMRQGHPNDTRLFDLKHDRGGIVDVEFIVQYLVLGEAHRHAGLTGNIGNLALLKLAAGLGLIPEDMAAAAHAAYREFRRLQHHCAAKGLRARRTGDRGCTRASSGQALGAGLLGPTGLKQGHR